MIQTKFFFNFISSQNVNVMYSRSSFSGLPGFKFDKLSCLYEF